MRILITFIIAIVVISNCHAQKKLTLDDCLSLARKNNLEIKRSELEITDADYGKKNAFTNYFPSVNASGLGLAANSGLLEANLSGIDLSFIKKGVYGGVSVIQPIFVGGQIINSNKLSNEVIELRKHQLEITVDDVNLLTERYYWQFFQLKEKKKTLEVVEDLVTQTLKEVSLSVKAGLVTPNNELQVKIRLDEVITNKLNISNNIEITKLLLAQHIGILIDSLVLGNIEYNEVNHPMNYLVDFESSVTNNNHYKMINKNVDISKIQTKIERGKLLPSFYIGGSYLFENIVDKNHTVGMIYASVSIPISGWWGGSYSIKQKKINEKIAEYNRIDMSEKIILQMKSHYKELEVAFQQIEIADKSVKNATENVRLNTNYYKSGIVTLNDLLDAQTLYNSAKDNYVDKYTEYLIKLSRYNKTIGR